jgi:putative toxin-antitoxin system antitoxin component (TIGR02293 family)
MPKSLQLPNRSDKATRPATVSRQSISRQSEETLVLDRATEVIGERNRALRWMGTPVRDLGYVTPISLVGTARGRRQVLTILGRLEHGVL